MTTTLNVDETAMAELRREAQRQGRTMSDLVETAPRSLFQSRSTPAPLPTFQSGGAMIDVADRDALHHAMEGRQGGAGAVRAVARLHAAPPLG